MTGSDFKTLKAGLDKHITTLSAMDGADEESVSEVNTRLDSFFREVHTSTLPREPDGLDDLSEMFEILNMTGFRKAKAHNLVYSPYLFRFKNHNGAKVKVKILGLEEPAFKKRKKR